MQDDLLVVGLDLETRQEVHVGERPPEHWRRIGYGGTGQLVCFYCFHGFEAPAGTRVPLVTRGGGWVGRSAGTSRTRPGRPQRAATVAGAARRADPALPGDLVAPLKTPEGSRFSELERLRRPPTRTTGTAFARALERVDEIGAYRLGRLRLSQIPPNRMAALARYALGSKAPLLERAAMLTAVMRHLEAKAIDEALDLFQVLMATRLLNTAKRKTEKERLSTLPQEDIARLSPLKHRNLNLLGRYSFTASTPAAGALRPLRDPEAPELDEDDDGGEPD